VVLQTESFEPTLHPPHNMDITLPELPSDDEITLTCSKILASGTEDVLSYHTGGTAVVAISHQLVVKFGAAVTFDEFNNQTIACQLLSQSESVRVPQPYYFFQRDHIGFIVMDYVTTQTAPPYEHVSAERVVALLHVFATIVSNKPGSLSGGPCRGLLWSDHHDFTPEKIHDIEKYFSKRLPGVSDVTLNAYPAVLHHGDLATRNLIIKGDQMYVLDWASAGYFPKLFEVAAMQRNAEEPLLLNVLQLIRSTAWLSEEERAQANHVVKAADSNIRYVV
jgi:hypothetical protein